VKFTYVPTGENLYFKIKAAQIYNDLKALAQDQALLAKIGLKTQYQSEDELLADYTFTDDYADRIKKNGLVAWEIKRIYPGIIPLRPEQLPLELPEVDHYEPTDTGESPLASMTDWVNITCRVCGHPAKRETDTMPNWAGSSWYFLRYTDAQNDQVFADRKKLDYWLPVDLYNGGMEHTTLHLLYSRFWHKFLYDQGLVPTSEPYTRRISHGMILGPDSQKMSKSRGNVINPDAIVEKFGADTLRLYEMFMGEYDGTKIWNDSSVQGIHRFLKRIWNYSQTVTVDDSSDDSLEVIVQTSIKKITEDIERRSFNTVISQLMIMFNALEEHTSVAKKYLTIFLQLLAPIAPHISEEIWQTTLGEKDSIHQQAWPMADESLLQSQKLIIPVQIAGKVRAHIEVQPDITEEEIKQQVLVLPQVMKYLDGAAPKKFIYVKGKIVNIVI
jgi:leucyl-tRNA synthetase